MSLSRTFCAVPIVYGRVVKDERHERKAKKGLGSQLGEVRKSAHLNFDGNADLLLDLFGGTPGPLADDRHVIVGDIRIGLDGHVVKGQHSRERAPEPPAPSPRTGYSVRNLRVSRIIVFSLASGVRRHSLSIAFCSATALDTTCWPGCRPGQNLLHVVRQLRAAGDFGPAEFPLRGNEDPVAIVQMQDRGRRHGREGVLLDAVESGRGEHARPHDHARDWEPRCEPWPCE